MPDPGKLMLLLAAILYLQSPSTAANDSDSTPVSTYKYILATEGLLAGGGLYLLNNTWYSRYPKTSFQLFNDLPEWKQMDKAGHWFAAYQLTSFNHRLLQWSGAGRNSLLYSTIFAQTFLGTIEILDGHSAAWGFSISDILANLNGSAMYILQERIWQEQRITMSFSFSGSGYAGFRPDLLGQGLAEEVLKDYNGQTYWFNINLNSFPGVFNSWPAWLDLSLGYGAKGMLGGRVNPSPWCVDCSMPVYRLREFYLAPGIRLDRLETGSRFLKLLFSVSSIIHLPVPAISWDSRGTFYFHPLKF